MVTFKPRASKIAAKEDAAIPLPSEETTPPVININFVIKRCFFLIQLVVVLI
jgi:hypothetical protein